MYVPIFTLDKQTDQTNYIFMQDERHDNQDIHSSASKGEPSSMLKPLFVRAEWDEEAKVWVATSDDVPGLATEDVTMERLMDKLKIIIPELLEANGIKVDQAVSFEVMTRRFEVAQTAGT